MNTTDDMDPVDIELQKDAVALSERRLLWQQHKATFAPIVAKALALNGRVTFPNTLDIHLFGDKHALAEMVRVLRTRGFSTVNSPPKKGDNSWRAFFRKDGVSVEIWLSFSSTVCRRVKVGTKMVEQDVYETVCDELTLPDTEAA
ncbi:MAG: hypothetical protein AB7Q37_18465 [Pyrinomonadaceae bacterium]